MDMDNMSWEDIELHIQALNDIQSGYSAPPAPQVGPKQDKFDTIAMVEEGLLAKEGASGDTTGAAKTLERGMTEKLYKEMQRKHGKDTTVDESIQLFLGEVYDEFDKNKGFASASPELKSELLDLGYNAGKNVTNWKNLKKDLRALKEGTVTEEQVIRNILDSANISGKTSKGLAKRRAQSYNKIASVPITEVEQTSSGEIIYKDAEGNIVLQYGKNKGKHPSSKAGVIAV